MNTVSYKDHYKEMVREFDTDQYWLFVLNFVVAVACFITFLVIDGKELVYSIFIPLDLFLNISKATFYHWYMYTDKRNKADAERLNKRLNSNTEPLLDASFKSENSALS